jgi:hypothetical protein
MFLIAGAYHIWFNWRTLVTYFVAKRESGLARKREMALSAVVTAFFVAGAVYQVPPLSYVLTLNNAIKQAWIVDKDHEPPMGHAELLTMASFTKKLQMDMNEVGTVLGDHGIKFKETESLAVVAKNHGTSPLKLYQLMKPLEGSAASLTVAAKSPTELTKASLQTAAPAPAAAARAPAPTARQPVYTDELVDQAFEGRGMGRKTFAMIADENGLDLAKAKKKLAARNVMVKDDDTLKEAASKAGTAPMDLMKIILVGEPVKS